MHTVHTSLIGRNKSGVSVNMLSSFFEIGQYDNVLMRISNIVTEILQNCHYANSKIYPSIKLYNLFLMSNGSNIH